MRIGSYILPSNVILAPMAGVSDRPFREIVREQGAGLTVSEMVSSNPQLFNSRKSELRTDHRGETGIRSVQIVGTDPAEMAVAAIHNVERGAQIIDINMGCPAKKVCSKLAGSALLRDETLVADILGRVVGSVEVPVTLKIRTGWSPDKRNGLQVAKIAEDAGIQALAVHGRTRACKFQGEAEYETIAHIKQSVEIPVIANGDIDSPEKALEVLDYTGADGVMVGRATQGNPWLVAKISHFLQSRNHLPDPTWWQFEDVVLRHLAKMHAFYGEQMGLRIARKHLGWYCKHLPLGERLRSEVLRVTDASEQYDLIHQYFDKQYDTGMRLAA